MTLLEVIAKHQDKLMELPNVKGVGEGEQDGSPIIIVWVDHQIPGEKALIPPQLDGFPVRVESLGGDISAF
jgi:hypothetical protein